MDAKRLESIHLRIDLARDKLELARKLTADGYYNDAVSKAYYAMFYAVLALLVTEPFQGSKHSGVIGYFNKRFIREGVFPPEAGKYLNLAFEARQESDYKEFSELTTENVQELLSHARTFIEEVRKYLNK